jgi:hypothetical protein
LSNQDYPVLVTAVLDGMSTEMKQLTKGLRDEVKWTYSRPQEYDNYNSAGNRNVQSPFWFPDRHLQEYENHGGAITTNTHLTLILQFPQIAHHRFNSAESYIMMA